MWLRVTKDTQLVELATYTPTPSRRVFDCCLFNGEVDVLRVRLHELNDAVDFFVIVESNQTFTGASREISFNPCDPRLSKFASKVRHVVVTDMPETTDPWIREKWQRNAVLRGAPDAAATDLLVLSDVDEIPRATILSEMANDHANEVFGVRMAFSYFYVNYRNVSGPESALTWTVAATRRNLDCISPDDLRYAVREGRIRARIFDEGGWHFSYLMDEIGIRRKIAAFSHQEFATPEFLNKIDIVKTIRGCQDLFNRPGFCWKVLPDCDLPEWLLANRTTLTHLFYPTGVIDRARNALSSLSRRLVRTRVRTRLAPVIVCPYLYNHEADEVSFKFGLERMRHVEFYLWQDKERIGPEFAFEHCWNQFPERDVILVHSDMAPPPGDPAMRWYEALVEYSASLPTAGMIACNLYYPKPTPSGALGVQCAGGTFTDGKIGHIHGTLDEPGGVPSGLLKQTRSVAWVTFGGVLIRRELIRACGPVDRRYQWAYVMDVDYCFEARLRGFQLMQVPVSLEHEENRTTRSLWDKEPKLFDHMMQNFQRFYAKWGPFYSALRAGDPSVHPT
jgi:hypothetical protein